MATKKKKDVSFEFWKVSLPNSYVGGFKTALIALSQVAPITQRNQVISGYTVRWEELEVTSRYFFCDFIKLRLDLLPLKGGVNAKSSSLNLSPNEGISEPSVFLFDTQSNILVVQHNHHGACAGVLAQYTQQLLAVGGLIDILPVFSNSGLTKLGQMSDIRRVSYKIAKPKGLAFNPGSRGSVDSSITTMDDLAGESIEVVISSGFSRRTLTVRELLKKATELMTSKNSNAKLEKFEVAGYSNGDRDEFDLVKEHMRAKISVPVGANRDLSYPDRKTAAKEALDLKRADLVAQFGNICA